MPDKKTEDMAARFVWGPGDIQIVSTPDKDPTTRHPNQVFGKSRDGSQVNYVRDDSDAAIVTNAAGTFRFEFAGDDYKLRKFESPEAALLGGDWHVPVDVSEVEYVSKQLQRAAVQKSREHGA